MKKTLVTLFAAAAITSFAANPHIKTTEKKLPDGRTMTDRMIYMNEGYFRLLQTSADGKNAIKNKWGEFFFGFEFGRLPRTNGSWSVWDFFSPWEYISEKGKRDRTQQPTMAYVPELVAVNSINGVAVADFVFPSYRGGKLKMRMMQFPSHPTWTFMRVQTVDFNLWRMDFNCYPHNSNSHKDRERHVATATKDFNLSKEVATFVPDNPYLGIYSKFLQDTTGNFLIYEPAKFAKLVIPRANACVTMQFFPKKMLKNLSSPSVISTINLLMILSNALSVKTAMQSANSWKVSNGNPNSTPINSTRVLKKQKNSTSPQINLTQSAKPLMMQ